MDVQGIKDFLSTPLGVKTLRIAATLAKSAITAAAAFAPKIGAALGVTGITDADYYSAMVVVVPAILTWWTSRQHEGEMKRTDTAVQAAVDCVQSKPAGIKQ